MKTLNDICFELNVPARPELAYASIGKPKEWWHRAIDGVATGLGDSFTVNFSDTDYVHFVVTEAEPKRRIVWHVEDCFLHWFENKTEWTGTDVIFNISSTPEGCLIEMVHRGLTPELECYGVCSAGWEGHIMTGLRTFITEGVGVPKGNCSN